MAGFKSVYICQNCGAEYAKWMGQCAQCKSWNTLVEEVVQKKSAKSAKGTVRIGGNGVSRVVRLSELKPETTREKRWTTGSGEFDRVLGGGMVPGSVILVAGEPGIGKSTLLTQLALKQAQGKQLVMYVCGEESPEQVALRVRRLGEAGLDNILMLATTDADEVVAVAEREKPQVIIVDSIQTLTTTDLEGMAGSVGQVREATNRLIAFAKGAGTGVYLVGHVTKEGSVAGPKVMEHMVDAVLTLEGERTGLWRILRAVKNRFGATDEVGVFEMQETGMQDVANPSGLFLEEAQTGKPGSVVAALMEGTRPVLVEIQALVVQSSLPVPRRVAHGVPLSKLQLLTAVLQKHAKLALGTRDVFVNVAGGIKVNEPAADLAIALAIASSFKAKPLPELSVAVGEVGLLGDIRRVTFLEKRIKEAQKLGYKRIVSSREYRSIAQAVGVVVA